MRCPDPIQLEAFVDGELSPDAAALVAGHLAGCDGCAAHVRRTRRLVELLQSCEAPVDEAAVELAALASATRRAAPGRPGLGRRPAWRGALIAASLVVALTVGLTLYRVQVTDPGAASPDPFSLVLFREHQAYQEALAADPEFNAQVALVGW